MAKHELTTPEGAPLQVETGIGRIVNVEHTEGKRNALVKIDATHLRQPVTGWVDTEGPMWPRVQWASANGAKVWYRVDLKRHRNAKAPISTPLAELDRMEKTRDLTRIERPESAPPDSSIGVNPLVGPADAPGGPASVSAGPATATDGHAPQGHSQTPAAAVPPPTQQQPATPSPSPAPVAGPVAGSANVSPRPQTAPAIPGHRLTAPQVEALREVVAAVAGVADQAWRDDCCNAAVAAGCTREQVLHVLQRAERGLDVGLPAPGADGAPAPAQRPDTTRPDAARAALSRQRDPDAIAERRGPAADPGPAAEGEAPRGQGSLATAHNGMSRRVSPRGNVTVDGKPYDVTNMDGSVNWASYAVDAVVDVVVLAAAQRMTRIRGLNAQDPDRFEVRNPTAREVDDLARTLLVMADRIQVHLRGGNRPDRMGASHKAARRALKEAIAVMAIPWGDSKAMTRWVEEAVEYACVLIDVAAGIHLKAAPLAEREGAAGSGVGAGSPGAPGTEVPPSGRDTR